ncbi:unnamed protein product, partial [Polarella glacialis]
DLFHEEATTQGRSTTQGEQEEEETEPGSPQSCMVRSPHQRARGILRAHSEDEATLLEGVGSQTVSLSRTESEGEADASRASATSEVASGSVGVAEALAADGGTGGTSSLNPQERKAQSPTGETSRSAAVGSVPGNRTSAITPTATGQAGAFATFGSFDSPSEPSRMRRDSVAESPGARTPDEHLQQSYIRLDRSPWANSPEGNDWHSVPPMPGDVAFQPSMPPWSLDAAAFQSPSSSKP